MILTRTDTSASVALPDDLYWEDEHTPRLAQSLDTGLTGAALIQEARYQYAPMTFRSWADDASWITRATLETLLSWANRPGLTMTLSRLGVDYSLRWRAHDGAPVERTPARYFVNDTGDPTQDPQYRLTLRFLRELPS